MQDASPPGMFSFGCKREPERTAVPAGHESPSGAFKPQTGLQSKCRVFSAARSQRFQRAGPMKKGLLAPFRPQSCWAPYKKSKSLSERIFCVPPISRPLSRCGGSSPQGSGSVLAIPAAQQPQADSSLSIFKNSISVIFMTQYLQSHFKRPFVNKPKFFRRNCAHR